MAVFDRDLGALSGRNPEDISAITNYIAYMREQVEYSMANLQRRVSALESGAAAAASSLASVEADAAALARRVSAAEGAVSSLEVRVETLEEGAGG